ncbi:MAG TPA: arginine deiminase family protein, partial [Solirubrobacteraceae bacterium]|nr:arginine deiminase family protein [Solirubrobacteraceae bacterium]
MSTSEMLTGQSPAGRASPDRWGLDNQTARLTDVLLARPDEFLWMPMNAISEMTFANMDKLGHRFDKARAMEQWNGLVSAFEDADVRCHFLAADPGLTHSVFARDSNFMTPWGPVVAAIQTEVRRRDYAVVARFFLGAGVRVWNWVTAGYFEGGDFAIIEPGAALLGYAGNRSTRAGAEQVQGWLAAEGWEAMTVPLAPQFVHMDAVVVMLGPKLALVCEDALERYVLDWFDARGIRRINVTYRECVELGGNVVALGDERVLSMSHNTTLNARLRAEGLDVRAIAYD